MIKAVILRRNKNKGSEKRQNNSRLLRSHDIRERASDIYIGIADRGFEKETKKF